jgi:hypothetical protein
MIVTVLWEDQRGQQAKSFGPHELVISSVADDLCDDLNDFHLKRAFLSRIVVGHPKKGNGSVLAALRRDLEAFSGPVVAVLDRDKAHKLWSHLHPSPSNCMQGIRRQFRIEAPGEYDLVFLINNVEDLVNAALQVMSKPPLMYKPDPDERDRILGEAVWGSRDVRAAIRVLCPSFDRIVKIVSGHCAKL